MKTMFKPVLALTVITLTSMGCDSLLKSKEKTTAQDQSKTELKEELSKEEIRILDAKKMNAPIKKEIIEEKEGEEMAKKPETSK